MPAPSTARPPDSSSSVATWSASTCGRRRGTGVTHVPSIRLSVRTATAPSVTHGSTAGPSQTHAEVIPEEERLPACLLRGFREPDDVLRLRERADVRGDEPESHQQQVYAPGGAAPSSSLRQLRGRERRAVEDVVLARLDRVQPVAGEHLADDDGAGDDHGRALGLEAGHVAAFLERQRGEPLELRLDACRARARGRGRGRGRTRRGRGRVRRASSPCRRRRSRRAARDRAARERTCAAQAVDVVAEALGQAHAAEVEARVEETPSGPPSTSSVEPPPTSTTSVPASIARPAVTPRNVSSASSSPDEQPGREAVAPLDLAEEGLAVLGIAHGARRDGERPLGAERSPARAGSRRGSCGRARSARGSSRRRPSTPSPSRVICEPPRDLVDVAVVDVGDEQARRVRAEVDRRDAGHRREEPCDAIAPSWPRGRRRRAREPGRASAGGARRRAGAARSSARAWPGGARAPSIARSATPMPRSSAAAPAAPRARPAAR